MCVSFSLLSVCGGGGWGGEGEIGKRDEIKGDLAETPRVEWKRVGTHYC